MRDNNYRTPLHISVLARLPGQTKRLLMAKVGGCIYNEIILLYSSLSNELIICSHNNFSIESVDSMSRDLGTPWMQYITNTGISCTRCTLRPSKQQHRYLQDIFYPLSVIIML